MFSVRLALALIASLVFGAHAACGADIPPAPVGQPALLAEPDYKSFKLVGTENAKVEFSVEPFKELGCTTLLHLKTKEACSAAYAAQIRLPNRDAIHKGDVILAHFYLRTLKSSLESQEGLTEFVIEDAKSFTKSVQFHAGALGQWREFFVPFQSSAEYAPGEANIIFRAGFQPQDIEVAGLVIMDYGAQENLARAPTGSMRLHYAGQAADAPWRAEAEQRIENIRKAGLTIEVVDGAGQPVPGIDLTVEQTRHAYWFGTAVRADKIVQPNDPDAQARYRAALAEMFNAVTFENDLKWPFWTRDLDATIASQKWLDAQGIALRGHVLVWPSHKKGLPETLYPLMDKPDELRVAILDHIHDITTKLQPAAAWDVLNETFTNHEFMDVLGRDAMPTWFTAAHADTPQSRLFINDWGIVTSGGTDAMHQADYEKTITYLLKNNAPLDGIGMQGHFGMEPTGPEKMLAVLDRFGKFGKEIQLTEYSTQFDDPNDAAKYLGDTLTIFFSHPATSGFILWGFRDGIGMQNKSFLYDKNWNLTPSGKVWKDLVYGKWWTNAQVVSAADGRATVSGFFGQYKITAHDHGTDHEVTGELKPGGSVIRVVINPPAAAQAASN